MSDSGIISPPRSSAVTALAVVNYLLGAARILVGVAAIWMLSMMLAEGPGDKADIFRVLGFLVLAVLWPFVALLALVSIGAGILLIIAGMGLRRRRSSARALTMVMGGLGGMLAALYGLQLTNVISDGPALDELAISVLGLAVHGGYCAFVFVVLLDRRNAAEFN